MFYSQVSHALLYVVHSTLWPVLRNLNFLLFWGLISLEKPKGTGTWMFVKYWTNEHAIFLTDDVSKFYLHIKESM